MQGIESAQSGVQEGVHANLHEGTQGEEETALYRHFDSDHGLLYVGISRCPTYRLAQHSCESRWYRRIAFITIEWHASRARAIEAEAMAIVGESPMHNKSGKTVKTIQEHPAQGAHATRHGVYADAAKRREYRRDWMRARRAQK